MLDKLAEKNPDLKKRFAEIDSFWDKKTLFVHRRALFLGLVKGIIIGSCLGAYGMLILYLIEVVG